MYTIYDLCKYFDRAVKNSFDRALPPSMPEGKSFRFEVRDDLGRLHNSSGPAVVWASGTALVAHWYRNGRRHRKDGPAVLVMDRQTGICTREAWFSYGHLHRHDGPAVILRKNNASNLAGEYWYRRGKQVSLRGMNKENAAKWFGLRC